MAKVQAIKILLVVKDAKAAIDFYAKAFGAVETMRLNDRSNGRIGHAELKVDGHEFMLADEYPEYRCVSPATVGGVGSSIQFETDDCDALYQRAVAAGCTSLMAPQDMFYGHRTAKVRDPFGHEWSFGQEIEKVSAEEMQKRFDAIAGG